MGPIQKALRAAGLPVEVASILHLEEIARKTFKPEGELTPADFRRAARVHRKIAENPRRFAQPTHGLTVRQVKLQLMREHGLTSGRQWRNWKRDQQRAMRAEVRADG